MCALAGVALALCCAVSRAHAQQEAPFCLQAKERAASDAALLMMPRLVLQELRFPRNNQVDLGSITGSGFQFRAALSFSFVDFYKGLTLMDVGDAACLEHESKMSVKDRLDFARDIAQLAALGAQVAFLQQRKSDWDTILSRAAERLSRRVITVLDFTRVQQLTASLERKLAQLQGDVSQLRARVPRTSGASLAQLVHEYTQRSARLEREVASSRALDAWQLRVSGGVIAQAPLDWYGLAELSVSFGAFVRPSHEHAYERARALQLATAPDELPMQVRNLRQQNEAAAERARHELAASERSVAALTAARQLLESFDAENVQQARDALIVESISAESEVVFLNKLIDALAIASK